MTGKTMRWYDVRRKSFLPVCALFLVIGGLSLSQSIPEHDLDASVRAHGVETVGTVVGIGKFTTSTKHSHTDHYYPITAETIQGEPLVTSMKLYSDTEEGRWQLGDRLPLLYSPADPHRVVANWNGARGEMIHDLAWAWIITVASVLGAVAQFIWWKYREIHPAPKRQSRRSSKKRARSA